jgi:hypothetical protein
MAVSLVLLLVLPAAIAQANPISSENAHTGSTGWDVTPPTSPAIEGYSSEASVAPGQAFHLHVRAPQRPGNRYRVLVYRLGWYGGEGGRLRACIPGCASDKPFAPQPAATPPPNRTTGVVRAGWHQTDVVHVRRNWVSGYYVAQLRVTAGPDEGAVGRVPLIVRGAPGDHASILAQVPVNTWQAYNPWGGKSLYDSNSTGRRAATKVSFDRPYSEDVLVPVPWSFELQALRFLEREGYDVSYATDTDVDRSPGSLLGHRLVLSLGHDEYWSGGQRAAWDDALARSTNIAALGANTAYGKVRYGDRRRTIARLTQFRSLDPGQPECRLFGVMYAYNAQRPSTIPPTPYSVAAPASDPWLTGTGLTRNDELPGIVGYEWDTLNPGCFDGRVTRLLHANLKGVDSKPHAADAVRGVAARSGARMFASGSIQFAWALDSYGGHEPSSQVQGLMKNALRDLTLPAAPRRLKATGSRTGTALQATRVRDPRVRRIAVYAHHGRARFALGAPGVTLVCRTRSGNCHDRRRARPVRYAAVALDRWGSSAPAYSAPLLSGR